MALASIHSPMTMAAALAVVLASHAIGGLAGFGSALLALPFLVLVTGDMQGSVLVLCAVGMVQSVHLLICTYRDIDRRRLVRMVLIAGAGMPLGRLAAQYMPEAALLIALGALLIASGLAPFGTGRIARGVLAHHGFLHGLLLAGGIIHGAYGTGGTTVAIYAQQTFKRKEPFRATLNCFWAVLNPFLMAMLLARSGLADADWTLAAAGVPTVLLANWIANRLVARMSHERFGRFVALLLIAAGISMLVKAVR